MIQCSSNVCKLVFKEIVQIHNGARREKERVRRMREGGYSEGTGRIQWGYSESTVGNSEDTVRVQLGYSGIP